MHFFVVSSSALFSSRGREGGHANTENTRIRPPQQSLLTSKTDETKRNIGRPREITFTVFRGDDWCIAAQESSEKGSTSDYTTLPLVFRVLYRKMGNWTLIRSLRVCHRRLKVGIMLGIGLFIGKLWYGTLIGRVRLQSTNSIFWIILILNSSCPNGFLVLLTCLFIKNW